MRGQVFAEFAAARAVAARDEVQRPATGRMQRRLQRQFALGQVNKGYVAVVSGRPDVPAMQWQRIDAAMRVDWPNRPRSMIDPVQGKASRTRWRLLEGLDDIGLTLRNEQDIDLQAFGVKFDNYYLESSLYADGKVNSAVDTLINGLIRASTQSDMLHYAHALDRVLQWNYYWIPNYYPPGTSTVWWNRFGMPATQASNDEAIESWWEISSTPLTNQQMTAEKIGRGRPGGPH